MKDRQESNARINGRLIAAVPELRAQYEAEIESWGEEMGPHVIYADLLNPYLTSS